MALPTIITVSGTLLGIDGQPEKGHVSFYSNVSALSSEDDTVVVPSAKLVPLDITGSFTVDLPATDDPDWTPVGWTYRVVVRAGDAKYGFETVIPYDAVDGEINFSDLVPALDGGSELYAAFSHTHEGGGGSTAWNDITGKPSTFPPSTHTHDDRYFTESEVTTLLSGKENTGVAASLISAIDFPVDSVAGKTGTVTLVKGDVGLGSVDNTSDASKPVSTATQTALDGKAATSHTHTIANVTGLQAALDAKADDSDITALDARVDDLESAGGSSMVVKRSKITSGDITLQNTSTAWQLLTGGPTLSIPAAVGDYIEFNTMGMRQLGASSFLDPVVIVSGSAVRYSSSNTGTPSIEGNPETYPNPGEFLGMSTVFEFVVEAGDISGGNVTLGFGVKANGTGVLYASTNYPLRLRAVNYGPVSVS